MYCDLNCSIHISDINKHSQTSTIYCTANSFFDINTSYLLSMFRRQAKDGNGSSGSESGKIDNLVHIEERSEGSTDQEADQVRALLNAKIANPLAGFTHDELVLIRICFQARPWDKY